MEFDRDQIVNAQVQKVKKKFSLTKFRLWFATVFLILVAVPFIRIILQANGTLSTAVATVYWLVITHFGFHVSLYPWHLVVAKSIIYSDRLKKVTTVVILLTMALMTAKSLLAPADLYRYESDSDDTTWWYSLVSSLSWMILLLGTFLIVPLYVRRMRLLRSKSWTLLSLVVPYLVVMLGASVQHEWGGDIKWISYSIPVLILLFGFANMVDLCSNTNVKFDEAYIMAAGFIPFWLGSVLGRALLTIFDDLGPLGSIVVFGAWKGLIFLFEVLSTVVGKKASRYNDGSVFSFCVIYTGSIYAEFIFQTVEFNSLKFWVLLCFRFLLIVVWQGGFKINLATLVGENFSSNWQLLRLVKRLTLSTLGEMPAEMAERACQFTASTAPPDVELAFIRSRAVVVQETWVENDIKMAADFQAVASAATTVTADFIWNYFGVGENMIKGTLQYKRGVLMIYVVNIGTLFLAQALARKQLHSKVVKLKKDMSAAVAKIIALSQSESQSPSTSNLLTQVDAERRASLQDAIGLDTAASGSGLLDNDDDMALSDLQEILSMTEALTGGGAAAGGGDSTAENQRRRSKGRRESGGKMAFFEVRRGSDSSQRGSLTDHDGNEDDDDDDWGCDVDVVAEGSASILKGGYLKLQCPKSGKFQKRYVVLNDSFQLMYYNNKSDVSGHIQDFKGVLRSTDVMRVQRGEEDTNRIDISSKDGVYSLQAYTHTEASEWHAVLAKGFVGADHTLSSSMERESEGGGGDEEGDVFEFHSNPLASVGRPRRNSVRRSSLGGEAPGQSHGQGGDTSLNAGDGQQALQEKRGLLKKKNKFFWEERWFELTKNGTLSWYKKARGSREGPEGDPRGSLSLRDVISVEQQRGDSCLVNVDIKGRTYELQADSEGLAAEWSAALVLWVEHAWGPEVGAEKKEEEQEVEVQYGEQDEVRPLVSVSNMEMQYNESIGRPSFSSEHSKDRDSFRDSFRSSDFRPTVSIHDHRLSFTPSTAHPSRKKGRRTSLRMSLIHAKDKDVDREKDVDKSKDVVPQTTVAVAVAGQETHGWVKKKGAKSGTPWQRRWVEIHQPGVLFWFASDTEAAEGPKRAKGSLRVSNILSVDLLPEDNRCFDINVKGRTYAFQSYSLEEARYWYDVLLAWMEQATREDMTVPQHQVLTNPGVRGRPQRSGYLLKRGVGSSRWQSRWFVLTATGGLFWYKNPEESRVSVLKAKGSVQLADVLDLELNTTKPTSFDLYVKGRTYELNASSEKEARAWIADIFKWVTELDAADISAPNTDTLLDDSDTILADVRETVSAATRSSLMGIRSTSYKEGGRGGGGVEGGQEEQEQEEMDTLFLPEVSGMVKKKGEKKGAKWHLRWLELTRTNRGQLAYYSSESEAQSLSRAKGVIAMADVLSVEIRLSSASASSTGCLFDVDVQGRTFQFEADSAASAKEWHVALLSWVEHKIQRQQQQQVMSSASSSIPAARRSAKPYRRCSVFKMSKDIFPRVEDDAEGGSGAGFGSGISTDDPSEGLLSATPSTSLSRDARPEQPAPRRGLLRKQGGSHGVWQERWCEVTMPGLLCWFVSEKDASAGRGRGRGGVSKAKGRLFLKDVISVDIASATATAFDVDVKGRTYRFQASSAEEARLWAESLGAWSAFAYSTQDLDLDLDSDMDLQVNPLLAAPRSSTAGSGSAVNQLSSASRDTSGSATAGGSYAPVLTYTPTVNQFGVQVFEKSGLLKKQGGLFGKAWQSRWFVLRDDVLTWYTDQAASPQPQSRASRPMGVQRASHAKGALGVHAFLSVGTEGCAPCCFDIDIQGRTIKFQARDEADLAAWLSVLQQNSKYLAEETLEGEGEGEDKVTADRLENFSPLFSLDEAEKEDSEANESEGGSEEKVVVVMAPEPSPEARDCLHDMLLSVERRAQEEEEDKNKRTALQEDKKETKDKETTEPKTDTDTNADTQQMGETESSPRNPCAVLLAQKSMRFLPKAWMPNADDVSDSEDSSDDDDCSSASGEYDDENDEDEDDEEGSRRLPRPHSSIAGAFATVLSVPDASTRTSISINPDSGTGTGTANSSEGRRGGGGNGSSEQPRRSVRRRGSDAADKVFVKTNANTNEKNDTFLNKLKGNSAGELNREFWTVHKSYLFHVTCFVSLHVLYVTSFVLKENDENAD